MPGVIITDISEVVGSFQTANNVNAAERKCCHCQRALDADQVECPDCGAINPGKRVRAEQNRPTRVAVFRVESGNYNGKYSIFKNSDGSLSCDCLSFLFQNGIQNGVGFNTCKHIRAYLEENPSTGVSGTAKPTSWQIVALKRLGVEISDYLTNAQAYFIFSDLLAKQGVEYNEYKNLLIQHGTVNLLPIYSFGVEFEGFVRSKADLHRGLADAGIRSDVMGYNHTQTNGWKIGMDSSVHGRSMEPMELASPKLFGADGFSSLTKALNIWREVGADVNKSCGTHVHIDAWNWAADEMLMLAKVWAKIEAPFIWHLVSPSRRNNRYCKALDIAYLRELTEDGQIDDRYYSLNLEAFQRHKTLEFRIHNATSDPTKIIPWIVFLLKLTDAVKKGLTYSDVEPTFDGVMDAVGMDDSATSTIKEARRYLQERYLYWKEDTERNPSNMPQVQSIDLDNLDAEIARMVREERIKSLRDRYASRWQGMANPNPQLPNNNVQNLAAMRPAEIIPSENMRNAAVSENEWQVSSQRSDRTYRVTLHADTDAVTCACRGFRANNRCYHSINTARFIMLERQLREVM